MVLPLRSHIAAALRYTYPVPYNLEKYTFYGALPKCTTFPKRNSLLLRFHFLLVMSTVVRHSGDDPAFESQAANF